MGNHVSAQEQIQVGAVFFVCTVAGKRRKRRAEVMQLTGDTVDLDIGGYVVSMTVEDTIRLMEESEMIRRTWQRKRA